MATEHEFGGQHTELKLSVIEKYLKAFCTALRPHFRELMYIDAFAGTGSRTVKVEARDGDLFESPVPESIEQRRGSAQIAIDVANPGFDFLVFMESKVSHVAALNDLAAKNPGRRITVIQSDANAALRLLCSNSWTSTRAVLFLDPYGMEVEWATLESVARTEAIDVWFLFPLSGLYRQATRTSEKITADKRAALDRMFGSNDWESELYSDLGQNDMFGGGPAQREYDVKGLERYVKRKLETIFPKVFEPLALPIATSPQRFSLFLCLSNGAPRALGLATRIANYILRVGKSS
jgi:three-Cys-motif partner protein